MGQQDWNQLGKHIFKPNAPIDARELVNSDSDIVNIDSAYVGMIVTVNSNPIKRYKIKKVTWEGHPDSLENGGYELIQEPKDLKYSDGVTPFLNNNGNIDADYLKFADIDGSEEEKSTEDDFNVKTDTLRIDGTTYENSKKQSIRNTIGAQENITSMQNVQPVIEALNNRTAKIDQQTSEIIALGYKVLNPNLSFAEQVNSANTIYEIKDSFDLNNGSVTIPANCTLKFNGGKLRNGTVVGNNTTISGDKFFLNEDIVLNGTFSNQEIYLNWFVFTKYRTDTLYGSRLTDISDVFPMLLALSKKNIYIPAGDYISDISNTDIAEGTHLIGEGKANTSIHLNDPEHNAKHYIGLKRASGIEHLRLVVYEDREIPVLFTSSILAGAQNADWSQTVYDVYILDRQCNMPNVSMNNIKTIGFKIAVTPFNENGELVEQGNYALSYRGNYDCIKIQYFRTCLELFLDNSQAIPDAIKPKIWCTSVYFTRLTLWGIYGISSLGEGPDRIVVSQYMFQSIAGDPTPFGVYGNYNNLYLDGYLSWDNSYRGKCNGVIIDLQVSAYNSYINRNSGYIKLDETKDLFVYNTSPYMTTLAITTQGVSGQSTNPVLYKKMADSEGYLGIEEVYGGRVKTNVKPLIRRTYLTNSNNTFRESILFNNSLAYRLDIKSDGTVEIITKNNKDVSINGKKISGIKSGLFANKGVGEDGVIELYFATDKKTFIAWNGAYWTNTDGDFVWDLQGTQEERYSTSPYDGYQYRQVVYTEESYSSESEALNRVVKLILDGIQIDDVQTIPPSEDVTNYTVKYVSSEVNLIFHGKLHEGYWEDCSTGDYYIDEEGEYTALITKYNGKLHSQVKILSETDPFFNNKILLRLWANGFYNVDYTVFILVPPTIEFIDSEDTHKARLTNPSTTCVLSYRLDGVPFSLLADSTTYTRGTDIVLQEGDQLITLASMGNKITRSSNSYIKVVTPEINISNGVMTITCATDNATIYYTVDGSAPTRQSTEYTGSVNVQEGTTVKAMAVLIGRVNSDVATETY